MQFWRDTVVDGGFADSATTLAAPAALLWHFATSCILLCASVFSTQLWLMQVWCQGKTLGRRIPAFNFLSHECTNDFMDELLGSAKAQPTFAMLCVYDNYEATRIQRIPFLVAACFFVVASICKLQFSNHPKSKTPGALFPIAPWATVFLALSTQTGDCNASSS